MIPSWLRIPPVLLGLAFLWLLPPSGAGQHGDKTEVPQKARSKHNPFENDPSAAAAGRKLFEQHCAACHGDAAAGTRRGPGLRGISQQETPGEIFWIMTNGILRRGMPAWSKLPQQQRWQIITFLQGLGSTTH